MWKSGFVHHLDALVLVFNANNISLTVFFGQANKYFRFFYFYTRMQKIKELPSHKLSRFAFSENLSVNQFVS